MKYIVIKNKQPLKIRGSVIDIETTGTDPETNEIITCGILEADGMLIIQRKNESADVFKSAVLKQLEKMPRPFYAFNKKFEEAFLGIRIENDVQKKEMESAIGALIDTGIVRHYNRIADPLYGGEVPVFWRLWKQTGEGLLLTKIVAHNYSSLIKQLILALHRSGVSEEEFPELPPSTALRYKWLSVLKD